MYLTELPVEDGVDDGVHRRVDVTEPGEEGEDDGRNARRTEGADDVDGEERRPAEQEDAHDDAERDRRLVIG